jgi:hypothetical protein
MLYVSRSKLKKFWLGVLLFIMAACVQAPQYPEPPRRILYLDTSDLSPGQKKLVWEAAAVWTRQTGGCLEIRAGRDIKIMWMWPEDKYDTVVGLSAVGMWTPIANTIEMSFGRLSSPTAARVALAHEIGHALGLHHVDATGALMAKIIPKLLKLTDTDRMELRRVLNCPLVAVDEK